MINHVLSGTLLPGYDTRILLQVKGSNNLIVNGTWTRRKAFAAVERLRKLASEQNSYGTLYRGTLYRGTLYRGTLYRGTRTPWPVLSLTSNAKIVPSNLGIETISDADMEYMIEHHAPVKLTHLLSCTECIDVATEFAGENGYGHAIRVPKSFVMINVNQVLPNNLSLREKEFISLPPPVDSNSVFLHPLTIDRKQRIIQWELRPLQ